MHLRILAFANLRELLGTSEQALDLPEGACVADVWSLLARQEPSLSAHRSSVRIARNGTIVGDDCVLAEGDELAVLPPVGGG